MQYLDLLKDLDFCRLKNNVFRVAKKNIFTMFQTE